MPCVHCTNPLHKIVWCRYKGEREIVYVLFIPSGNPWLNHPEDTPVEKWRLLYFSTNYFYGTQVTTFLTEGRVSISKKFKSCLSLTKDTLRREISPYAIRWAVSVANKAANGIFVLTRLHGVYLMSEWDLKLELFSFRFWILSFS